MSCTQCPWPAYHASGAATILGACPCPTQARCPPARLPTLMAALRDAGLAAQQPPPERPDLGGARHAVQLPQGRDEAHRVQQALGLACGS